MRPGALPWAGAGVQGAARAGLRNAAAEEVDQLAWCSRRLSELDSRPRLLNPLWYAGPFALGVLAGCAGPARNLGFMAETERQVEDHLDGHLRDLPSRTSDHATSCAR